MKKNLYKLILPFISIVLFLFIAETTLRLVKFRVNQTGGYFKFGCFQWTADKHSPPIKSQDDYLFWRCNSRESFRGRFHSLKKRDDVYRVICLGESTTQGYMMQPMIIDIEESYPFILETILNEDSEHYFEVINAGCGGYTSFQGLRFLKSELLEYNPDLLIIWFGYNDIRPAIFYSDKDQKAPNKAVARLQYILSHSRFYQFYRQGLLYLAGKFTQKLHDKKRVSPKDYRNNLMAMSDLAKSKGIDVLFITPVNNVDSQIVSWYHMGLQEYAEAFICLREKAVPVLDMVPVFKELQGGHEYFFDYIHTTPEGNRIIAKAIFNKLTEDNIIALVD